MASPSPLPSLATPRNMMATVPEHYAGLAGPSGKTEKVWVGVRIRPLLRHEVDAKEAVAWSATGPGTLSCLAEEKNAYQPGSYQYDRVFADSCGSEEVYAAAAQPMVQSAVQGYNCTLFAYGQTGSGKTTTMRSVMRHAAADIFAHISHTRDRDFVVRMCAIEVYNEIVHDLFVDADTYLRINDDKEKGPVVMDLTQQNIESEEHLLKMLKAIESRRTVRETKMNQKSSRSHLVVRLYVESRPSSVSGDEDDKDSSSDDSSLAGDGSSVPVLSTINFVDLAGSERLSQASMTDDADKEKLRQKEACNINVSLLTLGKVIRALGKRGEHVPYRESNLTRILQPSLSGNSRMAIICTLSPAAGSVDNSRAALHFANHAKAVMMRPVLNEVRGEQAIIKTLEVEIKELRRKLERMDRPERSSRHEARQLLAEKDAELKAKEEQMRQALQERATLERRLNQMEKFIIRGGSGSPARGMRRSLDGLDALASSLAPGGQFGMQGGQGRGLFGPFGPHGGPSMRASWNPSTSSPLDARERPGAGKAPKPSMALGRSVANPNRLLLDYLLPPGVREAVTRLGGEPAVSRFGGAGAQGLNGPGQGLQMHVQASAPAFNLRSEISKLQAPEGSKAQEALSALQAEVRCYTQQPAAAAVVAAAAGATPESADRLLEQLTQMLVTMEQRQKDAHQQQQASAAAQVAVAPRPDVELPAGERDAAQQGGGRQGGSGGGGAGGDEAGLMALLRAEVGRLTRLQSAHAQANRAIESLLNKMAVLEQAGLSDGGAAAPDGLAQVPNVLDRLQSALQEADAFEEGEEFDEEEEAAEAERQHQQGAASGSRGSAPARGTPHRRRGAAREEGEATSAQRHDSPAASAGAVATAISPAPGPPPRSSLRLSGSKLPRAQAGTDLDAEEAAGAAPLKSPRRGLLTSPHAAAVAAAAGGTPNSRIPRPSGMSASVGAMPGAEGQLQRQQHISPRAPPEADGPADELALRRMRTPSLSMQASEGEPLSAGCRTASVSSRGLLRWDTERAKRIIGREKDAVHTWYAAEVARLKAAFSRQQTGADVESMREAREAVDKYRGMFEETEAMVERLNMQKQLLINQVLRLEITLDEVEQKDAHRDAIIAHLTAERDQALYEAAQAQDRARLAHLQAQKAQAAAAQAASQAQTNPTEPHAFVDDDDWADAPTPETLLAEISDLWHRLHVPLVYRSRFFLLFRSKELIYLNMEQRRLTHRLHQIEKELDGDFLARSKPLEKAKRALDLERKVLAQALRYSYGDQEREALYETWGVRASSKGRKVQLVRKLWDPAFTRDQVGMEAGAQVVCALAGPDASEQFVQLVFGNTAEVVARPTPVGALVSTLVRRVTTPRQRKSTTPNGTSAASTASGGGSAAYYQNSSGAPGGGGVTPRRQSSSLLANLAGRVSSFIGATPRQYVPHALTLPLGAGAGGGGANAAGGNMGPMARGLANQGTPYAAGSPMPSARGPTPVPPLPPAHPGTVSGTPPVSARSRPAYVGPGRP